MEKGSDSLLPYLGLEGTSDHPGFQGSPGRELFISSRPEAPATKVSTLRPREISREISYPAVPMGTLRSQLPEEPLEPDDMRHATVHMKEGFLKKRHNRVGRLFLYLYTSDA